MCPVSDRPVSLAAVRRLIIECVGHSVARELDAELDALPTFAPATPDAPKSVEEMADAIGTILPCPFCGSNADHRGEAAYVRCTNLSCEAMGPSNDPTGSKWNAVPRGLPAPEWTGPDRWQHWTSESDSHPDDRGKPEPDGFMAIGAWQPFASGDSWTDWRRPLRRVQA